MLGRHVFLLHVHIASLALGSKLLRITPGPFLRFLRQQLLLRRRWAAVGSPAGWRKWHAPGKRRVTRRHSRWQAAPCTMHSGGESRRHAHARRRRHGCPWRHGEVRRHGHAGRQASLAWPSHGPCFVAACEVRHAQISRAGASKRALASHWDCPSLYFDSRRGSGRCIRPAQCRTSPQCSLQCRTEALSSNINRREHTVSDPYHRACLSK